MKKQMRRRFKVLATSVALAGLALAVWGFGNETDVRLTPQSRADVQHVSTMDVRPAPEAFTRSHLRTFTRKTDVRPAHASAADVRPRPKSFTPSHLHTFTRNPADTLVLFNGKDLTGWSGDPRFWRVEDGVIVGETTADNPTEENTFLIWEGGTVEDFHLSFDFRLTGGNSGVQYRSKDLGNWAVSGYQGDLDAENMWTGMLYEEQGRGIVARRGQRVVIEGDDSTETFNVVGSVGDADSLAAEIDLDRWNTYEIIARGNHLVHKVNGNVTAEVTDNQEAKRADSGILAFQIHRGPPMKIELRDITLDRLDAEGATTSAVASAQTSEQAQDSARTSEQAQTQALEEGESAAEAQRELAREQTPPRPRPSGANGPRFEVPEGFAVEEVYGAEKAGTVVAITFDSEGHLILGREDTSIVRLIDPDDDGTFIEEVVTDRVTDAQGLLFDGPDLLAVGMGPDSTVGLYRVSDLDGDGQGDRVELVTLAVGEMQEHGPHQLYFGPDGYLYWTLGNHTGLVESPAPLSPFRDYTEGVLHLTLTDARGHADEIRAPGGTFVRRDLQDEDADWEMVAGGFRNQYDGAFNLMGELFTFDSDMEWDRDLPWYRPVRTVHVVPGADYGWRTGSRKFSDYYIDTLPPVEDEGRGSPTGVVFYQSYSYPAEYWDAFLQADWSRGRILLGRPTKSGATYAQEPGENFVFGQPLNVTDVDVGPDGNVYFSLGGRDTEGGIYRVVYDGPDAMTRPEAASPVEEALTLAQPRSAFSRARAQEIKEQMGTSAWERALKAVATDVQAPAAQRVRALELLQVFGTGLSEGLLASLGDDEAWAVRAASTYYLGLHETPTARMELAERLRDDDPMVQRRAAEALVRTGIHAAMDVPFSATGDVLPLLESDDRFVRYAARNVLRRMDRNAWRDTALAMEGYPQAPEALLALVQTIDAPDINEVTFLLERELELLEAEPSNEELLGLLRVMNLTMLQDYGVEFAGRPARQGREAEPGLYQQIGEELLARFPTEHAGLNREIARTLAYLQTPSALGAIADALPDVSEDDREQQIFYMYALSTFKEGWEDEQKEIVMQWFEKVRDEQWKGGASYTGYLTRMWEDFLEHLPAEERLAAEERIPTLQPQVANAGDFRRESFSAMLSETELEEYLIYDPMAYKGDPSKGAAAYEKAFCATCHTFGPIGREFGPDLTTVGQRFSREDLVEAVLYPSKTISDLWANEVITKNDGSTVAGTIYREDGSEVVVQIPAGPQVTISKSEIESRERSDVSAMPEGLVKNLTREEMMSLFQFLEAGVTAIPDSMQTSP